MISSTSVVPLPPGADPFQEKSRAIAKFRRRILGRQFEFVGNDRRLLALLERAYSDLPEPKHSSSSKRIVVTLRMVSATARSRGHSSKLPPQPKLHSGAGFLCGMVDENNFVIIAPQQNLGLVTISEDRLASPYHVRYELVDLAVLLLAARTQSLVALHGACISLKGRAVLLFGESGAGKSTLTLHCLEQGLELVSEDSVLVSPDHRRVFGLGNYLHLRVDAETFLSKSRGRFKNAPTIVRRSGVKKFEIDIRATKYRIARESPKICAVVFLSAKSSAASGLLTKIGSREVRRRLEVSQAYAAGQPGWAQFLRNIKNAYVLHRSQHPSEQVRAVRSLLDES